MFLGGGGGYEIENKIEVYKLDNPSQNILKTIVHEEPCGLGVPNFFEVGSNVSHIPPSNIFKEPKPLSSLCACKRSPLQD